MKKQLLLILLLILQSFIIFIPSNVTAPENPEGYIIEGDSVIWENDWARLEVWPHTSHEILTHVQYANLTWKTIDKDIDVAFRFDVPISNGKIWKKSGDEWIPVNMYLTEHGGKYYYRHDNFHVVEDGFYQFKWQYALPINTSGKWELLAKLSSDTIQEAYSSGRYIMLDPWWDSDWTSYKLLTISNTFIPADLTNFPVLVNVSAATSARSDDGDSIRFLNIDNVTEYSHQLDGTWDSSSYNIVWVNITSVSSSADTKFLMYYNNSDATSTSTDDVWDSNYIAVYHLTNLSDSTSNGYDLTAFNSPTPTAIGRIGGCYDFEAGDSEYANNTNFYDLSTLTGCTIELWASADTNVEGGIYLGRGIEGGINHAIAWRSRADDLFEGYFRNDSAYLIARTTIEYTTTGIWRYHVATFTDDDAVFHVNRNESVHNTATSGDVDLEDITVDDISVARDGAAYYDGFIDELRISKVVRNASWLSASYNSTNQTSGFLTKGVELSRTQINTTTGIELTNATLHGWISDFYVDVYTCGFWIGRTTPVTDANADQNVTCSYTVTGNDNFSYNVSSLLEGTRYYAKAWIKTATYWENSLNEDNFYTKCSAPTVFTATASGCNAALAWTKSTGAVNTIIRRKADSYPASITDGDGIYNNTGTSYSDTTVSGSTQYYKAWGWAGDKYSDDNITASVAVPPCPPTSVDGAILVNNTLNITWTKGTGANTTLVVRKMDSSPTTVTDGTVMYNSTGTSYVATDLTGNYFYRLWSYANGTYSTSVALEYGALVVNCYDEKTNESIDFDILVTNQDGSETYESLNNTNFLLINVADLPLGDNIRIQISATSSVINKTQIFSDFAKSTNTSITQVILLQEPNSKSVTNVTTTNTTSSVNNYPQFTLDGDIITIPANAAIEFDQITVTYQHDEYEPRTYFRDFIANQIFVLNAYLPNADDSELYRITVEDDFGLSVNDALVTAKISVGGNFVIASSLLTDGNGNADIFLLPGVTYLFSISKTGYITTHGTWTPSIAAFIKTFKITAEDTNITTVTFGDLITFTGEWVTTNNTLKIYFNDKDDNTTDVTFSIYESYNIYLNLTNRTAFGSITTVTLYFSGLNTSRMHQIRLEMNHTKLGHILNQTIYVSPIRDDDRISELWLNTLIAIVMGNFDFGYVAFALLYCPCIFLIVLLGAAKQPGFGVLCAGLYIILVTWRIDLSNTFMIALSSLLILFGVIMIIVKHGKKLTGKDSS